MKNVVCPLCGRFENEFRFSERNYDVLACKVCELFFINPYGNNVHEKVSMYDYDNLAILDPVRHYASSKLFFEKYFSYIESECVNAKSILDVGCGTGRLLELMSEKNPNVRYVGIELNIERADFAKRVAKCEIFQIPIEKFEYHGKFDVITMINVLSHRPSNVDMRNTLHKILTAIDFIRKKRPVIFSMHPRTKKAIRKFELKKEFPWLSGGDNFFPITPIGYIDFLSLEYYAEAVLTDSGGMQEETTYFGIPCLTLRDNTERPVTIELGTNTLCRTNEEIVETAESIIDGEGKKGEIPPLWDGMVGKRIVEILMDRMGCQKEI